jgi:hypothetical protein
MQRVMEAIVNGTNAVIPYQRAALMLEQNGKLRLSAVSGKTELETSDPVVRQ